LFAEIDGYLLTQMQAVGGTTDGAMSYTAAAFQQDVAETQAAIMTGAGVRLPATHCWTTPTLSTWLLAQSDPQGRPLLLPHASDAPSAVKLTATGGAAPGYTATTLLGSHFFSDGNLADVPATNPVQAPIVFANAGEVFLMQSEPAIRVLPTAGNGGDGGPDASTLTVLIQYYAYVGVVVRHSTAVNTLEAPYLLAAPSFT
jgi:hypothetical protein